MEIVDSANIHSIGYDKNEQEMIIELHNGTWYKFEEVPESINNELLENTFSENVFVRKVKFNYVIKELLVVKSI
jgi:hypothetical protein